MKAKLKIELEFASEWELARLLDLIQDGFKILDKQNRTQRGFDSYTISELRNWDESLRPFCNVKLNQPGGKL